MISKDVALGALREFREAGLANSIWDGGLRIRRGSERVQPTGEVLFDGTGYFERDILELGGRDFQIVGKATADPEGMTFRRKIFELYTSSELNISLYTSGAGKNLDLLVNCGGMFDNYSEPAILGREFDFALKWRQETSTLTLTVDGEEIYSLTVPGFAERQTFDRVILGGSALHEGALWKGSIAEFKIYDGWSD